MEVGSLRLRTEKSKYDIQDENLRLYRGCAGLSAPHTRVGCQDLRDLGR
jgi:hypothetical protein